MATIRDNFNQVYERVDRALERSGRRGEHVDVVAVTKKVDIPRIEEAIAAGHRLFGENRIQEAKEKIPHFKGEEIDWHMVGHLQRNKVKTALSLFSMIHSLDSLKLAAEISKRAVAAEQTIDLLVQVNTTGEGSKFGIPQGDLDRFLEQASELPSIRIKGLMTIGPFTDDEKEIRRSFEALRHLFEEARGIRADTMDMRYISMGMTGDFEIAIEEGSNMIRIGTALFGPREQGGGQVENYTT